MIILKVFFLWLSIHYGFVNFGKLFVERNVPFVSILTMSLGMTGFIMMQFVLGV